MKLEELKEEMEAFLTIATQKAKHFELSIFKQTGLQLLRMQVARADDAKTILAAIEEQPPGAIKNKLLEMHAEYMAQQPMPGGVDMKV